MEQAPVTKTCIKCNETKVFELFEKRERSKDGRRNVCRKCRIKADSLLRKSKKVDKPLIHQEPPVTKTCTCCKETKEFELFKTNNRRKFGRDAICKKCDSLKFKKYNKSKKYNKPKKPYLNHAEPPPTMACKKCGEVKESRFFVKDKYKKFGIKRRCQECERIKQKQKYKRQNHSGLLTDSYLRKLLSSNLNIHSSQITDEQVRLQRESILLQREYKQVKLFFEEPEVQKELQREKEELKLLLEQRPLVRTCTKCNETKDLELFVTSKQNKFGKSFVCKKCHTKKTREYRQIKYGKPKVIQPPGTRTCTKCKETKDFEFFSNSSSSKYGKLPVCKKCKSDQRKKHYKYKKKLPVELPVTRVCKKCEETKPLELFTVAEKCRFGRSYVCKECTNKRVKEEYKQLKQQLQ